MIKDSTVPCRFIGGPRGGEIDTVTWEYLNPSMVIRVAVMERDLTVVYKGEELPPSWPELRTEEYTYSGRDAAGYALFRWVDPVPAMRSRIAELEAKIVAIKKVVG